jgi:septal ring factor EnvC (AmiA/AmiB activator)
MLLAWAGSAYAAPQAPKGVTPQDIRESEQSRAARLTEQKDAEARASQAAAEEQRLTAARIAAAAKLRVAETATTEAAARLDDLAARKREAEAKLAARAEAMQPLLPLIQRLSLYPVETLLAVPAPPENRLRGILVLKFLSRQLEAEAEALRQDQIDLDAAARAVKTETPKYVHAVAAQAAESEALGREIAAARALRARAESDAERAAGRAAAEASRAESLRQALAAIEAQRRAEEAHARDEAARLERQKRAAEAEAARRKEAALARPTGAGTIPSGTQAKGQLVAPVAGRIIRSWGDGTEAGPATGVSYQVAPAARVVAPCGGRVVFSDQFRSYGLLVIVDCGGGYHVVMAGLDRLDAKAGQSVQMGEPVGVMPDWQPGGTGRRPSLYVELRQDGHPVNPAPWLRTNG